MQSKMIAYDPLTGEIRGVCLTPPQVMAWQAQGLAATDGPEEAGLDTHRVVEGQVAAKVEVQLMPDQSQIVADGQDQAVVTVTVPGQDPPDSLELTRGQPERDRGPGGRGGRAQPHQRRHPLHASGGRVRHHHLPVRSGEHNGG